MLAARPVCSEPSINRVGPSTGPESRYAFRVQNYHRIDGVEVARTVVRRSPTQVLGLDQHPHAIAHFVDAAEFAVEVTEADEAARRALCLLAGDDKLPSVEAEKAFLAYGRDGRDVRVCVEIKILRHVRAESSRRPPRHRRAACSMAWRCRFLTARRSQRGHVIAER